MQKCAFANVFLKYVYSECQNKMDLYEIMKLIHKLVVEK